MAQLIKKIYKFLQGLRILQLLFEASGTYAVLSLEKFTFTELRVLSESRNASELWNHISDVFFVIVFVCLLKVSLNYKDGNLARELLFIGNQTLGIRSS